jgi:hypothetical protein
MKRMILIVMVFVLTGSLAQAKTTSVPPFINYQGKLTDGGGNNLKDGKYTLYFRIWNHKANDVFATNLVWGEKRTDVSVVGGQFNVILGNGEPLSGLTDKQKDIANAFSGPERYLGIAINNLDIAAEIKPRQQILSAPFAIMSRNGIPIGGIMSWVPPQDCATIKAAEAQLPGGFAICDGPDAKDDPATVFDETRIPNLMDKRFLMGDSIDNVGKPNGSNLHKHKFKYRGTTDNCKKTAHAPDKPDREQFAEMSHNHSFRIEQDTEDAPHVPKHLSVLFIIRVN